MKAVFDPEYIRRITGTNVKEGRSKMDKAEMLMDGGQYSEGVLARSREEI